MPTTTIHISSRQRLVSLARRFETGRAGDAAGRCLSLSLEVALAARAQLGIDVQLVTWHVVGDPTYIDHWAVLLDDQTVIDPTRVQVDGRRRLLSPLADYPGHFSNRRVYPASLLLDAYAESETRGGTRLTNSFLWTCGTRQLRFDLAAAWRERKLGRAAAALSQARTFASCFVIGALTRAIEKRMLTLMGRLHTQPDLSARNGLDLGHPAVTQGSPITVPALAPRGVLWAATTFTPAVHAHVSSACVLLLAHA